MKKVFDKVIAITLGVISLFFVVLMLVTAFGGLEQADLDNSIVKALLITLAVFFAVLTGLEIAVSFRDNEKLTSVLLFKDKESATKATVSVVKKTAKRVTKNISEAKIGKITILADDNGNARLKVDVKLATDATMETVSKLRAILIDAFINVFGIEFASIDFRVVNSKNTYQPSDSDVKARTAELMNSLVPNAPADNEGDIRIQSEDGIIIPEGGDTDNDLPADETAEESELNGNAAEDADAPAPAATDEVEQAVADESEAEENRDETAKESDMSEEVSDEENAVSDEETTPAGGEADAAADTK